MLSFLIAVVLQAQPAVGDLLAGVQDNTFHGWQVREDGADYVVFSSAPNAWMIALVDNVGNDPRTNEIIRRIRSIRVERSQPGEESVSGLYCPLLGEEPALALFNPATRIARGFFLRHGEIQPQRWLVDDPHGCEDNSD